MSLLLCYPASFQLGTFRIMLCNIFPLEETIDQLSIFRIMPLWQEPCSFCMGKILSWLRHYKNYILHIAHVTIRDVN